MNDARVVRSILTVARELVADEYDDFMRLLNAGGYTFTALWKGKKPSYLRRVISGRAQGPDQMSRGATLTESNLRMTAVKILDVKKTANTLLIAYEGTAGKSDVVAFMKGPTAEFWANKWSPGWWEKYGK